MWMTDSNTFCAFLDADSSNNTVWDNGLEIGKSLDKCLGNIEKRLTQVAHTFDQKGHWNVETY